MAKTYLRGDDYKLYLNTGSYGSPTWALIKAMANPGFDPQKKDIVIPENGISDGHLQGYGDPLISATIFEDTGDANVTALVVAAEAGTLKEVALANGPIATAGTKFWRLESCILSSPLSAAKGEPASFAMEFRRHANSDNDIVRSTAV